MPPVPPPRRVGLGGRRIVLVALAVATVLMGVARVATPATPSLAAAAAATAPGAESAFELRGQLDGRDAPGGPLDLRVASFGQQDTLLQLRLRTFTDWPSRGLSVDGSRRLCVTIVPAADPDRGGDVCVAPGGRRVQLQFVPAGAGPATPAADGRPATSATTSAGTTPAATTGAGTTPPTTTPDGSGAGTPIAALVGRPDDQTVLASFPPSAIGLPAGDFSWFATARWADGASTACPTDAPCVDRLPDTGAVVARSDVLVQPRCYGAAARDPEHPCVNPALRTLVRPTPLDATITPNAYCERLADVGTLHPCAFGLPAAPGRPTMLLVGDSHAAHWRAATEVVTQARGWHGISITRSGCPFTVRPVAQSPERNAGCKRWALAIRDWLGDHPEIRTVITSSHALEDTPERRADYRRTWAALPTSVLRIFVVRDTPAGGGSEVPCIDRARAARRPAGLRCSESREQVLRPDPNVAAARESDQPRVKVIDLTRFFCGAVRCLPVVGGALVRKDAEHLSSAFSTTLGPYLQREIARYGAPQG